VWLLYSLLTILFWGAWGFLVKVASYHLRWYQIYVLGNVAALLLSFALTVHGGWRDLLSGKYALYGVLAGVMGTLGYIFFILSTEKGKVSIVVPLTATYPVITFLLGVLLLGEKVEMRHVLGTLLAVVGAILLSL